MKEIDKGELLLGKNVPVTDQYSPELLYPIPRDTGRAEIGLGQELPFYGTDLWHAYELSWLDARGKPVVRVGRFTVPASSPNMVESKSFKLYLNSLNSTRFESDAQAIAAMVADVSAAAGAQVTLELLAVDAVELSGNSLSGECLDSLEIDVEAVEPVAELLSTLQQPVEEALYSHLLRSLCPVTGQPDWATVWIHYRGKQIQREGLLRYIIAFRRHQEFHEQCVERMFSDIQRQCVPEFLQIQAFYTRRGGLDINPFRSTEAGAKALPRLDRQ